MIIDGKNIATQIQKEIKTILEAPLTRKPCLVVIQAGDHPPSHIYIKRKMEACASVGILSHKIHLPITVTEADLLAHICSLNDDDQVDGILIQLPLPPHVNSYRILQSVNPDKDIDGFHPINIGKLLLGATDGFAPCTPLGIKELLIRSGVEMNGKHAVILGRSTIVGKPTAAIFMQNAPGGNATVTIAHSKSRNINSLCLTADVLIAAIGKPKFVTADMVKPGAVIIDVGINAVPDPSKSTGYKIVGDVDFEAVKEKCSLITPVPGGVGPMTIAMLLSNTVRAFQQRAANLFKK